MTRSRMLGPGLRGDGRSPGSAVRPVLRYALTLAVVFGLGVLVSILPRRPERQASSHLVQRSELVSFSRSEVVSLRTRSLDRRTAAFEPGRDIFSFATVERPETAVGFAGTSHGSDLVRQSQHRESSPPEVDPEPRLLGILGPERLRIQVMKDRESLYLVTEDEGVVSESQRL